MDRLIGKPCDIKPELKDIDIIWITVEGDRTNLRPSLWFSYNNKLYYCIFDYIFSLLETYDDWEDFNYFEPSINELNILFKYKHIFIKADSNLILNGDLGEFCQFEIDFINEYKDK